MNTIHIYDRSRLYCEALTAYLREKLPQKDIVSQQNWTSFPCLYFDGEEVAIDKNSMSARDIAQMLQGGDLPRPNGGLSKITRRERDVLGFLLKGCSNKEIAKALDLQVVTVKLHVRGICKKLGAANRTQAALIARENLVE